MVKAVPPTWLAPDGEEDLCLGTRTVGSFDVFCLPSTKPADCMEDNWVDKLENFDGDDCDMIVQDGHSDPCLGTLSRGPSYHVFCLPKSQPETCLSENWENTLTTWQGEECEEESDEPVVIGLAAPTWTQLDEEQVEACLGSQTNEGFSRGTYNTAQCMIV